MFDVYEVTQEWLSLGPTLDSAGSRQLENTSSALENQQPCGILLAHRKAVVAERFCVVKNLSGYGGLFLASVARPRFATLEWLLLTNP